MTSRSWNTEPHLRQQRSEADHEQDRERNNVPLEDGHPEQAGEPEAGPEVSAGPQCEVELDERAGEQDYHLAEKQRIADREGGEDRVEVAEPQGHRLGVVVAVVDPEPDEEPLLGMDVPE